MRSREAIDDAASEARTEDISDEERVIEFQHLILDVLLDIRELLQRPQPRTMMLRQVEVSANADKGLHDQNHQHS